MHFCSVIHYYTNSQLYFFYTYLCFFYTCQTWRVEEMDHRLYRFHRRYCHWNFLAQHSGDSTFNALKIIHFPCLLKTLEGLVSESARCLGRPSGMVMVGIYGYIMQLTIFSCSPVIELFVAHYSVSMNDKSTCTTITWLEQKCVK